MALFACWVLSPFAALALAGAVLKRWMTPTGTALYSVMAVLSVVSLLVYGEVALGPPRPRTAFAFLALPAASWLAIAIVLPLVAMRSGRHSHRSDGHE
jgi:hypothetical protein